MEREKRETDGENVFWNKVRFLDREQTDRVLKRHRSLAVAHPVGSEKHKQRECCQLNTLHRSWALSPGPEHRARRLMRIPDSRGATRVLFHG